MLRGAQTPRELLDNKQANVCLGIICTYAHNVNQKSVRIYTAINTNMYIHAFTCTTVRI